MAERNHLSNRKIVAHTHKVITNSVGLPMGSRGVSGDPSSMWCDATRLCLESIKEMDSTASFWNRST